MKISHQKTPQTQQYIWHSWKIEDGHPWAHFPMWEQLPGASRVLRVCFDPNSPRLTSIALWTNTGLWVYKLSLRPYRREVWLLCLVHPSLQYSAKHVVGVHYVFWIERPTLPSAILYICALHSHRLSVPGCTVCIPQSLLPYTCPHCLCLKCPLHLVTSSVPSQFKCHFLWKPSPALQVKSHPTVIHLQSILGFFFIG